MKKRYEILLIVFLNAMIFAFVFVLASVRYDVPMTCLCGIIGVAVINGMFYLEDKLQKAMEN